MTTTPDHSETPWQPALSRRRFLRRAAAGTLALTTSGLWVPPTFAKRGSDTPQPGSGKAHDRPHYTSGGPLQLPAWAFGGESAAADGSAMLMFRGNPSHTFYGTGPVPKTPGVLWRRRMEDFDSLYYGTPHRWAGTGWTGQAVYYAGFVFIGSQGRNLYAYEAETGKRRWQFRAKRQFKASLCLYDNKLYIGNVDDWLRCFDAATGEVLWRINTGRDLDSSACVTGGKLYIAGENGNARCLNPQTGELIWKTFVGGINRGKKHGSYGSETSPAVADGEYYCATYDGDLFQLDAETGDKRWKANTGDDTDASPVVSGEYVYAAAQEKSPYLFCFNRKDGSEVWRKTNRRGWWSTPAIVGETLYIAGFNGRLYALNKRTGAEVWVKKLESPSWSSPAVVDGKVIVGAFDGRLWCLDSATGKTTWVKKLGGRIHSTPIVMNGRIYIGTGKGWFYCLADVA